MTHDEALSIVLDIASRYGENAEEIFPRRLTADDTDDQLRELIQINDEFEEAKEIRNLWKVVKVLTGKEP